MRSMKLAVALCAASFAAQTNANIYFDQSEWEVAVRDFTPTPILNMSGIYSGQGGYTVPLDDGSTASIPDCPGGPAPVCHTDESTVGTISNDYAESNSRGLGFSLGGFGNFSASYRFTMDLTFASGEAVTMDFVGSEFHFVGWTGTNSVRISNNQSPEYLAGEFRYGNFVSAKAPEPATWALMVAGFGAIGVSMRRRAVRRSLLTLS